MTITKIFTQKYVSYDCEARHWTWVDTDKDYDALAESIAQRINEAIAIKEEVFA